MRNIVIASATIGSVEIEIIVKTVKSEDIDEIKVAEILSQACAIYFDVRGRAV